MGNIVSPVEYANATYRKFGITSIDRSSSWDTMVSKLNHKFGEMLEDFVVNDTTYQQYTTEAKTSCIGTMFYLQSFFNTLGGEKGSAFSFCFQLIKTAAKGKTTESFLKKSILKRFRFSAGRFYRRKDTLWVPCASTEVQLDKVEKKLRLTSVPILDLGASETSEIGTGRAWIVALLNQAQGVISTFNENRESILAELKTTDVNSNEVKMNAINKLPCHSMTVKFADASACKPKASDLFTVRLPFDPSKETTSVVKEFVGAFACEKKDLASTVARWGQRQKPTLTMVIGPKGSGKKTLTRYARTMFGPFATINLVDDFDLIRTCFVENEIEFADNERSIQTHPSTNLVFVCSEDRLPNRSEFGGRQVFRLTLTAPIEKPDPTILQKVTTRLQLGSGLGWCLKNFDTENDNFLETLLEQIRQINALTDADNAPTAVPCGSPNCTWCKFTAKTGPTPAPIDTPDATPTATPDAITSTTPPPADVNPEPTPAPSKLDPSTWKCDNPKCYACSRARPQAATSGTK